MGIKALKNNLSKYLRDVRSGETVWVTDRNEVIAEIHKPTTPNPGKVTRWESWLTGIPAPRRLSWVNRREARTLKSLEPSRSLSSPTPKRRKSGPQGSGSVLTTRTRPSG